MWNDEKFVAFDFETSGELPEYALQPWRVVQGKAWATSLVTARKAADGLVVGGGLDPTPDMMKAFLEDAVAHGRTIVGWNTVFDIQWLIAYGLYDLVMQARWLDGMLLWKHVFIEPEYDMDRSKKRSYRLKDCVREILPQYGDYEEGVDFHSTDPEERRKLHEYNLRDVVFTLKLARHWYKRLEPQQLKAALIEAQCLPLVAKANIDGLLIDTLAARELDANLQLTAAQKLAELAPDGVTETTVRSPIKLAKLLFDDWGLPVFKENTGKKTGKKSRATDKETLHELSFVDPRAKTLRTYREALNNRTKFAIAPLVSVEYNGDERSHPAAIVFGTYSGRLTYASKQGKNKDERQTGFALHQEKRGAEFRSIVIPPPGYTLVEFDASGQEFRWMAVAADDPVMLDLCLPGEDAHAYMGARIVKADYKTLIREVHEENKNAKSHRQLGKVANLSLQYRTTPPKLRAVARVAYNLPMELDQAKLIHRTYQRAYQRVPIYWDKQIASTKRRGYVETFAGRRVQVRGNWEGKDGWSMGSTAINYRIQGTGADQKYLAMMVMRSYLVEIGAYFAWDLHDGIYLYVPTAMVEKAVVHIGKLLNNLPYKQAWGFTPPIPLPWDCKVGASWGSLKEWKGS
jgi:DNA polymerase I-like protein with 3'-5' exonuclease and polymerase domains